MSETVYEYEGDRVVRSVTTTEPEWTDADRGLVLALLAEQRDTCPMCGHPMSQCRDEKTAGGWTVIEEVCQPSRVAQAVAHNVAESKKRGVALLTKRS